MRAIVFCTTCKHADGRKLDEQGQSAGEVLIGKMRELLREKARDDVDVATQACLWNCTRPCSVIVRDDERFSYITGGNAPTRSQAEAILAWFDLHGATETGEVPIRQWPDQMRGHFIARIPPAKNMAKNMAKP